MKKPKIYLDTSVISFYFADDSPERRDITRKFFDQELSNGDYEIYISALVLEELRNTNNPELRDKMLQFARQLPAEIFLLNDEVDRIATEFTEEEFIPKQYFEDALHLAFALVNDIDYIISWNFKHIVKPATKKAVRVIALKEGIKEIQIITPEEVIADESKI